MAEVTVQELAESIGTPVARLLTQMGEAGLKQKKADQSVSDDEKQTLLTFLKRSHGDSQDGPRKITLTRKVTSQIRAPGSAGRGKTVSIEVRKKRTYEKRDTSDSVEISVVTDSVVTQRADEDAKLEAARMRQTDEKRVAAEAEVAKKAAAEAKQAALTATPANTDATARRAPGKQGADAPNEAAKVVTDRANSKKSISRKPKQLEDKDAAAHHRPAERPKGNKHQQMLELIGDNEEGGGRRRRRKSKRRDHQFQQPTTPMLREVGIGESISVSDLAQQLSAKSTEVVKILFKMGVVANPNMVLDQDTAILVVEEMGQKFFIVNENAMEDSLIAGVDYSQDLVTKAPKSRKVWLFLMNCSESCAKSLPTCTPL